MRTPIHPGDILAEELQTRGLNANQVATVLRIPSNRITAIIRKQRGITADTALRLQRFFGVSAEFWMTLQEQYELDVARELLDKEILSLPTCEEYFPACA